MSHENIRVSIVIPAHNEAQRIESTINRIFQEFSTFPFEVVVCEDGSTDETPAILDRFAEKYKGRLIVLHHERRLGKGYGFLRGVKHSNGRYIVLLDADFPTNTEIILKIVSYLESGYDVVVGSRAHELSILDPPPPPFRQVLGTMFNAIVRRLFRIDLRDTQCGVKGFRREVFNITGLIQFTGFVFDLELLVKAYACKLKVIEIPIYWSSKMGSKVHVLRDAILMANGLLNIWLRMPSYRRRVVARLHRSSH